MCKNRRSNSHFSILLPMILSILIDAIERKKVTIMSDPYSRSLYEKKGILWSDI